jgi:hypothetical protein
MAKSSARQLADIQDFFYGGGDNPAMEKIYYTSSTTSQQTLTSINKTIANTFVFKVDAKSGGDSHLTMLNVLVNGNTVTMTEYGTITSNTDLASYDVSVSGDTINLRTTPINSATEYSIIKVTL